MTRRTLATGIGAAGAALVLGATVLPSAVGATNASGSGGKKGYGHGVHVGSFAKSAVGLTESGTKLVAFNLLLPQLARTIGTVHGLQGDQKLVGIDYRVQDRKLYGVGDKGGIYTLSTSSAKATKVSQLSVALSGTHFGVDFNPAADRLRVISDSGQNLRHDVNPGGATIVDGTLTTPPATTTTTGVSAAAYTNNDLDPSTATTLFDLDTAGDQVMLQSPANSGQLAATGKLGVDAASNAGFDIYSKLSGGRTSSVQGYATLSTNGRYGLYSVSVLTGGVHKIGSFPSKTQVSDLAVSLDR